MQVAAMCTYGFVCVLALKSVRELLSLAVSLYKNNGA